MKIDCVQSIQKRPISKARILLLELDTQSLWGGFPPAPPPVDETLNANIIHYPTSLQSECAN